MKSARGIFSLYLTTENIQLRFNKIKNVLPVVLFIFSYFWIQTDSNVLE